MSGKDLVIIVLLVSGATAQQNRFNFNKLGRHYQYYQPYVANQIPPPVVEEIKEYFDEIPEPTLAEEAREYWKENNCVYPPQDFWSEFGESCSEIYNDNNIYSGLCRTFYNSSQQLCALEGAEDDEKETMLRISELQKDVTDDDICDTLVGLKQSYPNLFPNPSGENAWFSHTNNLLFRNESCRDICGMPNLHPICFGILLNYDYINSELMVIEMDKELDMTDDYVLADDNNYYEGDFVAGDDIVDGIDIEKLLDDFDLTYEDLYKEEDKEEAGAFDDKEAMEKYYDFKVDETVDEQALEELEEELAKLENANIGDEEVLFGIDYAEFGNPKILNKLQFEGIADEAPIETFQLYEEFVATSDEWEQLYGYKDDGVYNEERDSLMGAVLAFSCLLLLVVVAYIVKMRHRLFGRGNRTSRPNRWNYKKVSTETGHY